METRQTELSRRSLLAMAGLTAAAVSAGRGGANAATPEVARLFYTETGTATGKNVMLLHGWTCDSHDWSWQLPALECRYRVVAVDLRGHGRSEVMRPGAYAPADYVADIESLISSKYPGHRSLTVPVYHLCRDPAQADRMRPWFSQPKSKVDVWGQAGHWIMLDRPAEVNAVVTAWIDAL